jgi:hypothetical protein
MLYLKDERDKSNMKLGSEVEDMRLSIWREMRKTKKNNRRKKVTE